MRAVDNTHLLSTTILHNGHGDVHSHRSAIRGTLRTCAPTLFGVLATIFVAAVLVDLSHQDQCKKAFSLIAAAAAAPTSDAEVLRESDLFFECPGIVFTTAILRLGPPANSMDSGMRSTAFTYSADGCTFPQPVTASLVEFENNYDVASGASSGDDDILCTADVRRALTFVGCAFEEGGLAVQLPSRRDAFDGYGQQWSEGCTTTKSALWHAAPLNVTVASNRFDSWSVLRFSGFLPPMSHIAVSGNTFARRWIVAPPLEFSAFVEANLFFEANEPPTPRTVHPRILIEFPRGRRWLGRPLRLCHGGRSCRRLFASGHK